MWDVAAVHSLGVIFYLFTHGPRPITGSSHLLTSVFTHTILLPLRRVLAILPISFVVVLWDGAAGCVLGMLFVCVISRE